MRLRRDMSRKAGRVRGCKPHNIRRGKEHGPARSLYSRALRKNAAPIAKHIIKVSSYSRI